MKNKRTAARSLKIVSLLALASLADAQTTIVRKVEPENWWVNYTPELTLLLTGGSLNGVHIRKWGGAQPFSNRDFRGKLAAQEQV